MCLFTFKQIVPWRSLFIQQFNKTRNARDTHFQCFRVRDNSCALLVAGSEQRSAMRKRWKS